MGSLRDREVACSASDRQGSNFESCVWRAVSSQLSYHPQEVLLATFSLCVHMCGLNPIHCISFSLRLLISSNPYFIQNFHTPHHVACWCKVLFCRPKSPVVNCNIVIFLTTYRPFHLYYKHTELNVQCPRYDDRFTA